VSSSLARAKNSGYNVCFWKVSGARSCTVL
jgi:hypothetical protein